MPRQAYRNSRAWARQALVSLLCLVLAGYFACHTIFGRHGLAARSNLLSRLALLDFELESLESLRVALVRDVALLSLDPPHPDLVEEIARDVLGFAYPEDRVWIDPQPEADGAR